METSLIGPTTRIIWHDPNVNNDENVSYFLRLFSQTEIERFTSYEKVVDFLYEAPGFWIVITSGSKGRRLLELIHDSRKVIGIVIFCLNKKFHDEWARYYPKVKKVAINIAEVASEVELLYKRYLVQGVLQVAGEEIESHESSAISHVLEKNFQRADNTTNDPQDLVFHHSKEEYQLKFVFVAKLLLEDHYHDYPEYILSELKRLNPKSAEQIEQLFKPRAKDDLLGAILYMYSTNHIYRPFNQRFASQAYNELAFTLSACLHQIMQRPYLKVDPRKKLYRGLSRRTHQESYIVNDETIYWPAFTSTSLDIKEAERFAGNDGVIFEITLSEGSPYPNVVIEEDWTAFPREKEVILFSHFPMKVKSKEPYGSRILIKVEQDESDGFLSLNRSELSKYWGEFIHKSVKSNYEAAIEIIRSKILQDFNSSNAVAMFVKRWDLNEVLDDQRFTDRLGSLKSYVQERQFKAFSEFLEFQLEEAAEECRKLRIYFLYKEISARLCQTDYGSLVTEMSVLLNGFAESFIRLNQENSNKKSPPAALIARALEETSVGFAKLDEEIKIWINEELEKTKPELIKIAEQYWKWEHRPRI